MHDRRMGFPRPRDGLAFVLTVVCAALAGRDAAAQAAYVSPFSITLAPDIAAWTTDFPTRLAAIDANTTPAKADWYRSTTSWATYPYGPLNPQLYSSAAIGSPAGAIALQTDRGDPVLGVPLNAPPPGVDSATWQRQRVLAAANDLLQAGTAYQHLHLPTFDPAQVTSGTGFPWSPVSTNAFLQSSWQLAHGVPGTTVPNPYVATYGTAAPGIDCTDFTAWVYNVGLGIQMHSGTPTQVKFAGGTLAPGATAEATVLDSTGTPIAPQFFYGPNFGYARINEPGSLDALVPQLQSGDLLFMGNPTDGILHVVMWLGQTGTDSAGNTFPLVISSHDNTPAIFDTLALDATGFPADGDILGHLPPPGVHILPFASSNWFYQDFQIAMRVLPTATVPEIDPAGMPGAMALVAAAVGLCGRHGGKRRQRSPESAAGEGAAGGRRGILRSGG